MRTPIVPENLHLKRRQAYTNHPNRKSKITTLQNSPDSSGIPLVEQIHEFALQEE